MHNSSKYRENFMFSLQGLILTLTRPISVQIKAWYRVRYFGLVNLMLAPLRLALDSNLGHGVGPCTDFQSCSNFYISIPINCIIYIV